MRRDKEAEARLGGMDYALRQIEKIGTDEFRKELQWRNRNGIDLPVTEKDLVRNSAHIREAVLKFVLTVSIAILHDEYDFETEDCNRFRKRFNLKCACMDDGLVSLDDYAEALREELGIDVGLI